jgi:CRP-like cAMP-binding protein
MMQDVKRAEAIQTLIPLLQSHQAFNALSPEQLADFANRAEIRFCPRDTQLTRKGEYDPRFFVVVDGQLRATNPDYIPPRLLNYHIPGEIVGVRTFLSDSVQPRSATIEAEIDSIVAIYEKNDWDWLIAFQPAVADYFKELERRFEERAGVDFPGRQPDEVVVAHSKRHIIAFIANLSGPLILLIIAVLVVLGDDLLGVTFLSAVTNNLWLTIIGIVIPLTVALLLAVYHFLDWRNEDFIVTSRRVIHIERVLLYRTERHEAPLTRIQNVTVRSQDWLDEVVGSRDIEIKTAGAGTIAFNELPNAGKLSEIILEEQARAKARSFAADTASLRKLLGQRLKGPSATAVPTVIRPVILPSRIKMPKFHPGYFLPRIIESKEWPVGSKKESAVVWRKHYFVLLRRIILPALSFLILFYLTLASLLAFPVLGFEFGGLAGTIFSLGMLISLGWYLWQYDGWRRDIYVVTETRIIDVLSSPFKIRGEQQREGDFDSIQNIYFKIPNFFSTVINIGDVIIETAAGAAKNFTFTQVYHPSAVQEEIFERWEAFQRKKIEKQRDQTNKQIVDALGEYHFDTYKNT